MPSFSFSVLMISNILWVTIGARPREGSSRRRRRGRAIRALPIASICCSPPLRVPACCFLRSVRIGKYWNTRSISARTPFDVPPDV